MVADALISMRTVPIDDQVSVESPDRPSPEPNFEWGLSNNLQAGFLEDDGHGSPQHRLRESVPEFAVGLEEAIENAAGEFAVRKDWRRALVGHAACFGKFAATSECSETWLPASERRTLCTFGSVRLLVFLPPGDRVPIAAPFVIRDPREIRVIRVVRGVRDPCYPCCPRRVRSVVSVLSVARERGAATDADRRWPERARRAVATAAARGGASRTARWRAAGCGPSPRPRCR